MKNHIKALLAALLAVAAVGTASAQARISLYANTPQAYYPPVVEVQPRYVVPDQYYSDTQEVYVEPDWQARREWRRAERLRREQWRQEQWRRQQWRHEHERRDWAEWRDWDGRRD
jgi:hypothetical protein